MPRRSTCLLVCLGLAIALRLWTPGLARVSADEPERPSPAEIAEARTQTGLGAQALVDGRHDDARAAFRAALTLVPGSREAQRNLALAFARIGQQALNREDGASALDALDRALELHPRRLRYELAHGEALLLLGRRGEALRQADSLLEASPDLLHAWILRADAEEARGELDAAVLALTKALALVRAPQRTALARELAELRKRATTEAGFLTHATGNFVARYGPDADPGTVRLALTLLEDAYSRVTADLGMSPRTPALVILYEGNEFQEATGAHGWVGALYVKGTLRVPIRNLERHQEIAARILSHEFTHHVLRQRAPGLPVWWHEGIAQHEESKTAAKERQFTHLLGELRRLNEGGSLLTLTRMHQTQIASISNVELVTLYYAQARAFVDWLVAEQGSGALPAFLVALGTGRDTSQACKTAFGRSEANLWDFWRRSL